MSNPSCCASCGQSPCACPNPSILNQPRLLNPTVSGGTFTGGIFSAPTIAGGTATGQQIVGATIDCTTQACTQPQGTCGPTIATTGFVCVAIANAISGANPDFCNAVALCLGGGAGCGIVASCINTIPGIIQNPAAFDPLTFANIVQFGPIRVATLAEVQGASCLLAVDPCTLGAFWSAGGPNALWTAFTSAVNAVVASSGTFCAQVDACITTSATLCAAVTACGFATLASPVFTGDPQAPTAAPGDADNSIANTAFVMGEINTAVSGGNPAFCAAVAACGYALLLNPVFIGDPQAPTQILGDNDTSIATTAFVQASIAAAADPIFFSSATTGNVAATETDAYAHVLTAGRLAANGDAIEFEASGTFSASASVDKQIRVYFGATIVFDSGLLTIASADWHLKGTISRTAAAAQKVMTTLTTSDGTVQAIADYDTAVENTALAQTIKLTFNGTLANDVVGEVYRDRYVAA